MKILAILIMFFFLVPLSVLVRIVYGEKQETIRLKAIGLTYFLLLSWAILKAPFKSALPDCETSMIILGLVILGYIFSNMFLIKYSVKEKLAFQWQGVWTEGEIFFIGFFPALWLVSTVLLTTFFADENYASKSFIFYPLFLVVWLIITHIVHLKNGKGDSVTSLYDWESVLKVGEPTYISDFFVMLRKMYPKRQEAIRWKAVGLTYLGWLLIAFLKPNRVFDMSDYQSWGIVLGSFLVGGYTLGNVFILRFQTWISSKERISFQWQGLWTEGEIFLLGFFPFLWIMSSVLLQTLFGLIGWSLLFYPFFVIGWLIVKRIVECKKGHSISRR